MNYLDLILNFFREVSSPLTTLLAVFFGAWFAYRFQNRTMKKKTREDYVNAANRSLFNIFQMLNTLRFFQKELIDPLRGNPAIFLSMQPLSQGYLDNFQLDFNSLSFVLNSKHKQILLDLFIEQQRYKQIIEAINYRSSLHSERVQPALERAGLKEKTDYPVDLFAEVLGQRLFTDLQRKTEMVVREVDNSVKSLEFTKNKMFTVYKELFPKEIFLNFEEIK